MYKNKRFDDLYMNSVAIKGNTVDIALVVKSCLPRASAARIVRILNASHCLCYVGLSDTYTRKNLFTPLNEKCHFLTDKELERIDLIGMESGAATCL